MMTTGLKLNKVSKTINGIMIVDNVTAAFFPGIITSVIGPNGAGKTTLFHLIAGALKPDSGNVLYSGENITSMPTYEIARKGIGRLFQDVRIFENLTVFENVASACYSFKTETPWYPFIERKKRGSIERDTRDKVDTCLNSVSLWEEKDSPASSLSYGQQKLLAIARLLAGGFSLLLLDEPTAGLNQIMIKKVLAILERIVTDDKAKTIVLVEHNMSVVTEVSNWVYFMHEGKIAFFGRTDHVLGDKDVREIYLGV